MQMAKFFVLGRADVLGALLERPGRHAEAMRSHPGSTGSS